MNLQKPPRVNDYELFLFLSAIWAILSNPLILKKVTKDDDYTVLKSDGYIGIDDTTAPRTVTLPGLASIEDGAMLVIKDQSGGAETNNITVEGYLAETIDGALTKKIDSNYGAVHLVKMSTGWYTI